MVVERRLPAEWEPQSGVMLTWPHQNSDWAPFLTQVEPVYVQLVGLITRFEKVLLVCFDQTHQQHISRLLEQHAIHSDNVVYAISPSNDSWARDHGPITVECDGKPQLLDFHFNGWGGKYQHDLDDRITALLHTQGKFNNTPIEQQSLILEGGSIESDGLGTLLTTSDCLLNPNRNAGLTKSEIEAILKQSLGVDRFLWLDSGWLAGDDTDSHIDMLARFCDASTIAYTSCDDVNDKHYTKLEKMKQELEVFTDRKGEPYKLVPLPIPEAIYNAEGDRLPGSYANFLIINQAVLVPQYGDKQADKLAIDRLQACFSQHEVLGINCRPLINQFGSLHCISMQLPQGVLD